MIESTRPKLNPFKYAAMLLGVTAVAAVPLAFPAIATAEANTWDIEKYDQCVAEKKLLLPADISEGLERCCWASGGYYHDGRCWAPPAESASGSRQLPGNVHIPSDIATAPATKTPPRPIQVPTDIATVSAVN